MNDRRQILDAVNLEQLWLELVGDGKPAGHPTAWPCPNREHQQSGRTPPVGIDTAEGLWLCHGCGAGGTAVDLLHHARGLDVRDAFAWLRQRAGQAPVDTSRPRPAARTQQPPADPSDGIVTGDRADDMLGRYLTVRRWRPDVVDAFGLQAVIDQRGRERIRHPFRTGGVTRWWQDRALGTFEPKWKAPAGLRRVPHALDLEHVLDLNPPPGHTRPVVFLAEGPADVIAMWHTGALAVGVPGTEGLDRWLPLLADTDVLCLFDADPAGDKAADHLAQLLPAIGGRSARVRPPDGLDLDTWRQQVGDDELGDAIIEAADRVDWTTPAMAAAS